MKKLSKNLAMYIAYICMFVAVFCAMALKAEAANVTTGTLGDNGEIQWYIDGQTLYITGEDSGLMGDEVTGSPFVELWEEAYFMNIVLVDCKLSGSIDYLFANLRNVQDISFVNCDMSAVTSMKGMFKNCENIDILNLSGLDTSNVVDMSYMFEGCWQLNNIGTSVFDTSSVTNMSGMFRGCQHGSGFCDLIEQFNMSQVTDVSEMFYECDLEQSLLDLKQWNTSSITKMNGMFYNANNLSFVDLSGCDLSNVQDMSNMFYNCTTLFEVDMSEVNACELENMQDMFYGCINLKSVDFSYFGAKKVKSTANLFMDLRNLESVSISDFAMGADSSTSCMFLNCVKLTSLDLSRFDVSKVVSMSRMFESCEFLESLNLTGFNTGNVTNMSGMFKNCGINRQNINSSSTIDLRGFNTSNVTNMSSMFENFNIGYDVSGFDTSNVTDMSRMFYNSYATGIDKINYSRVKNVENMFYGFSGVRMDFSKADFASIENTKGFLDESSVKILYTPKSIRSGYEIPLHDFFYDVNSKQYTKLTSSDCGKVIARIEPVGDTVAKEKYQIKVVNTKGEPIFTAFVNYAGSQKLTGGNGKVEFNLMTVGQPLIKITHPDYLEWTNENTNYEKNENRIETIVIYTEEEGVLRLKNAICNSTNVLTQTKKLSLKNKGNYVADLTTGDFVLTCEALDSSKVKEYQLWQNNKLIKTSQNGQFFLNVENGFEKGGNCYVRVISDDGLKVDTHVNLTFVENYVNKNTSLSLMNGSLKINLKDSNIPMLGGSEFSVKMPELPVEVLASDEKLYIGFNVDLYKNKDNIDKYIKNLKEKMEKAKRANDAVNSGRKDLLKEMKDEKKASFLGVDWDFNLIGYGETDWGSTEAKCELYIEITATKDLLKYSTLVGPIPVTVSLKGTAEGKVGTILDYDLEAGTIDSKMLFDASVGINAFGGIGHDWVGAIGVYGDAKVGAQWSFFCENPGLEKVDLTGELGIKAYALGGILKYEKAFAHNVWHIYSRNNVLTNTTAYSKNEIFEAQNYKRESFDYLANESVWNAYGMELTNDISHTNLIPLLENTFVNAQPFVIGNEDAVYATFLRADEITEEIYVVVTRMKDGVWENPIRIDEDSILDGTPQLLIDKDGTIWLSYTKTRQLTDNTNLLEYAQNQSLVVGTINPDGLEFTKVKEYENKNYTHMNQMSLVNGKPTLAWIESGVTDANSVLNPSDNKIYISSYSNGKWSDAICLGQIDYFVSQLVIGDEGVGCVVDMDGDIFTTDDSSLFTYSFAGEPAELATAVQGKVIYGVLPGEEKATFIWNKDGQLCNGNTTIDIPGITNEYVVIEDAIYYSAFVDGGTELAVVRINNDQTYSEPILLTASGGYLENLSVIPFNNSDIVFGISTDVVITETNVNTSKDLVWGIIQPAHDIRINYIDYDTSIITPGESVPVTIEVTNAGDHDVNEISIYVNGQKMNASTVGMQAGQLQEITVSIPCPSEVTEYVIQVIDSENTLENDYTPDNNRATMKLGQGNFVVEARIQQIGENMSVISEVANMGTEILSGTVIIKDACGNELFSEQIIDLESGATRVIETPITVLDTGNMYYVTVTSEQEELYLFDNSAEMYLPGDTSTAITYTISYMLDGGMQNIHNPISYQKIENDIILLDPTKEGYQFAGWYSDEELSMQITKLETGSIGNIILYAKWIPNVYHVEFDGNGASGAMESLRNQSVGTSFVLPENVFVLKGHTFIEWNTKADGSGQAYKDCQRVENITFKNGESVRLYAQWAVNKYAIEFDGNGADVGTMNAMTDLLYGQTYCLPTNVYQKEGYTFIGWNTKADGGGEHFTDGTQIESLTEQAYKVVTLYAQWKKDEVNILINEIVLSKNILSLKIGDTDVLAITVTPDNATNKTVTWKSSDTAVAIVDATGKVTAVAEGTATITATATDGTGISATCTVTVTEPEKEPVPETPEDLLKAFVERMYTVALGRAAEAEGLDFYVQRLLSGDSNGACLAESFLCSPEFLNKGHSDAEYVKVLYRTFFDREPAAEEVNYWVDKLSNGQTKAFVLSGFVNSDEFDNLCAQYGISRGFMREDGKPLNPGIGRFAERLYTVVLERAGEKEGIEYWSLSMANGVCTPKDAAKSFFLSQEYINKNTSDAQYITTLYRTFMDREPEAGGVEYWQNVLNNGATREQILEGFADSAEFKGIMASFGL